MAVHTNKRILIVLIFLHDCSAKNVSQTTDNVDKLCRLDVKRDKCINNIFCNRTYNQIYLDVPPYNRLPIDSIFKDCCGDCFKIRSKDKMYRDLSNIKSEKGHDFVYPVLGKSSESNIGGIYFLPIISHSGFYYVTQIRKSSFELAVNSCLQMWPMFLIFIFLSIIFGFIFWLFEAYHTESEYPKAFPIGWIKGTWWGLISLVSQGPESTPKSVLARIFAFLWIFVAVILVGIVTSIITATMVRTYPTPNMDGKTIVTNSNQTYNEYIILKNYGRPYIITKNDTKSEIGHVLELGLSNNYGGALVDKYLFKTYLSEIRTTHPDIYDSLTERIFVTNFQGEPDVYYGIGMLDKKVFEYFKNIIQSYILENEILVLRFRNNLQNDPDHAIQNQMSKLTDPVIFNIKQPFVKDGLIYSSIIIASFVIIGIIYEGVRRRVKVKSPNQ